jgi:hypothetical protein
MSTTQAYSTTPTQAIVPDPDTGDHAMYLNSSLVGFARTVHEAQSILDQLAHERQPDSPFSVPLPPRDAIAEALEVLAAHDDNPAIYTEAARQIAAGVTIAGTDADRLIDGMLVRRAPPQECWPWPWRCACGDERCWHGALLDGILFAWERLGDDPHPLPFDTAA